VTSKAWRGPDWFEPRLPTSEECSLGLQLQARAQAAPDGTFAFFEDGTEVRNGELLARARALAAQLRDSGVVSGDIVAVWQPNSANMLYTIFACAMLGAAAGQINIAFRGGMLTHALKTMGAKVMVAHGELVERLADTDHASLELVIATEPATSPKPGVEVRQAARTGGEDVEIQTMHPWNLAAIIFTSGTTGPSKGVRVTCCQFWSLGNAFYGFMGPEDRMLLALPMFHVASLGALWGAVSAGAAVAVMEVIRADTFWHVIRRTGATATQGLGTPFLDMLLKAPPSAEDRNHTLRRTLLNYNNATGREFTKRFGVDLYGGFSMSETSAVTLTPLNYEKDQCVGRPRKGLEVRLVDENDVEVPVGTMGELIIRTTLPWVINDGYHGAPEATVKAWRNGWFHTGDLMVADDDGDLYYRDRLKDAIRRRGENISSVEVEAEVRRHPLIEDVAAIGVRSEDGDEEVLIVVAPRQGATVDPAELLEMLIPRMPHYMVPRYVRVMAELPKTQTTKVQKTQLRAEGVTADTWDREAAGIRVRRQKLTV